MASQNFSQTLIKQIIESNPFITQKGDDLSETSASEKDSFFYDGAWAPLKSSQQLNVDWSSFENHTFFMSAEVKVNLAFENIINKYPFDGTQIEVENFIQNLTGFERWVFEKFPRYKGSLHFSSSYISVLDVAGAQFPELSKNNSGQSVLNPSSSLSIEFQIKLPTEVNNASVICQKSKNQNQGFSIHLLPSVSLSETFCQFVVVSGSHVLSASAPLTKGQYNHVCAVLDRGQGVNAMHGVNLFVNETLVSGSGYVSNIGELDIDSSLFLLGSGSSILSESNGGFFVPNSTLSGSLDELRLFHSNRSQKLQLLFAQKSIFANDDLKLYYKFNEPPPPIAGTDQDKINSIVLDSSGNGLHAYISNFTGSLRQKYDSVTNNSMPLEKDFYTPVLFPAYHAIADLNQDLLTSASLYDENNPNIITRLIPPHYLLEGANYDGFGMNTDGNINQAYAGDSIPGTGKLGSQQVLLSFLYIWAKFFDEIKLYVDQFSNLNFVGYDDSDTVPNNFLLNLLNRSGFNMPKTFFTDSTVEQYLQGENIEGSISTSNYSLKQVKYQLMRRMLVSLPTIISSKGTQHAIKSFLRSVGIDPDNSLKIREYGGPTKQSLLYSREKREEIGVMLNFNSSSYAYSPFLSASRIEPGYPYPAGNFINGSSDNVNDGLFTSGSWSYEATYKLPLYKGLENITQSLVRILTTGSYIGGGPWVMSNLIAYPEVEYLTGSILKLFLRPHSSTSAPLLSLQLNMSGAGLFDGEKWTISFGCVRNDEINSEISSSYFIRAASQNEGYFESYYQTSSFFMENPVSPGSDKNQFRNVSNYNVSGSYLEIGKHDISSSLVGPFLNLSSYEDAQITNFSGKVSNVRFWSKRIDENEFLEHVRNYKSVGVDLPSVNYNFVNKITGSFQKLRLDAIQKQGNNFASGTNGIIELLDFSQNNFSMTGINFNTGSSNMPAEVFQRNYLSPYFDESSTSEKVRARGLNNPKNISLNQNWAVQGPAYYLPVIQNVNDDPRFSIDFSLVDALNKDIINIFSTLDSLSNALGDPNLQFSSNYPDIEKLQDVYFNRLTDKINFAQFFEFFRWFDQAISPFIDQLIPRKTIFKGTNFVVEPHMLERSKHQYYYFENYNILNNNSNLGKVIQWAVDSPIKKY